MLWRTARGRGWASFRIAVGLVTLLWPGISAYALTILFRIVIFTRPGRGRTRHTAEATAVELTPTSAGEGRRAAAPGATRKRLDGVSSISACRRR